MPARPCPSDPPDCACGARYFEHRSGLDFKSAQAMLVTRAPDPADYRSLRRNGVLGFMREIKLQTWYSDHSECG